MEGPLSMVGWTGNLTAGGSGARGVYIVMIRIGVLLLAASSLFAQLTPEQKAIDLQSIASLYAKQYAPYEWKRDNLQFDLFDLRPWLERARATRNDVEYLDLVAEYTASLQDIHSYYTVNSDFTADLHIYTDIYDGKVLIEDIDRSYLPASRFDFAVGDEIVLFDGKPVLDEVRNLGRFNSFANPRSTLRWATDYLSYRVQAYFPSAVTLGDTATILVRRANGTEKSYTIPWEKTGTALTKLGPLPNFRFARTRGRDDEPGETEIPDAAPTPRFRQPWLSLQNQMRKTVRNLRGFGSRDPIYRQPQGFTQRLGRVRSDFFNTGTYQLNGKRIGFIRIGTFQPTDFSVLSFPLNQFASEIAFMKANTDALVVDVTRNPGGYGCYAEALERFLIPQNFTTAGVEIRPNLDIIRDFEFAYLDAMDFGEDWEVRLYGALLKDVKTAYSENRGRTGTIPLCGPSLDITPARDRAGNLLAYNKPILVLTDEFSTSAAEIFSAIMQDSKAAKLFGYRTAGAGGNTVSYSAGFFSEGTAAVTQMLTVRPELQQAPGFPATRYLENIGVRPDIDYDFQTRDNLVTTGSLFADAFYKAALALIP